MISIIAHDGVLAGKCPNFPGQLRVAHRDLLQSRTWVVNSVTHGTLSEGLRYIVKIRMTMLLKCRYFNIRIKKIFLGIYLGTKSIFLRPIKFSKFFGCS